MNSTSNLPKPKLACEIAADRVLAGRFADNGGTLEASAARELAPGSVVPDLVENNLRQRDAVRAGIEAALGGVAGRSKDVICNCSGRSRARDAGGVRHAALRSRRSPWGGALSAEEIVAL